MAKVKTIDDKERLVVEIGIQVFNEHSNIRYFFTVEATNMLAFTYREMLDEEILNRSVSFEKFCLLYMELGDRRTFFRRDLENSYHMQVLGKADEHEVLGYKQVGENHWTQESDICVHYAGLSALAKYYIGLEE